MKNIILIITDTFRYDNLKDRGKYTVRTPNLDNFSKEATRIENFITGSFPTIPHRTDVQTGRVGWPFYPWTNINGTSPNRFSKILAENGYATQLICDCPHLFNAGFQKDFNAAYQHRGQEGDIEVLEKM